MAIDGNWKVVMQSPMGARDATAEFASAGGALSGAFGGAAGAVPLSGSVDGNKVNWAATVNGPMGQMELKFDGTVDGDALSGTVAFGAFGSGSFTGTRA
ncbi:MAG: hypothetical protein C0506_00710 [Anaerolinea sp.]|nr:hypothetical protein [Anaerolinea sp.]